MGQQDKSDSGAADRGVNSGGEIGGVQLAQAAAPEIGRISEIEGNAAATGTDGSTRSLSLDSPVYQGDEVATSDGATLQIVFLDGTEFSLGGSARIELTEAVYDSNPGVASLIIDAIEGTFIFVTGAIAGTAPDAMQVRTPIGTVGIRGTKSGCALAAGGSSGACSVFEEEDGEVGVVAFFNDIQEVILDTANQTVFSSGARSPLQIRTLDLDELRRVFSDLGEQVTLRTEAGPDVLSSGSVYIQPDFDTTVAGLRRLRANRDLADDEELESLQFGLLAEDQLLAPSPFPGPGLTLQGEGQEIIGVVFSGNVFSEAGGLPFGTPQLTGISVSANGEGINLTSGGTAVNFVTSADLITGAVDGQNVLSLMLDQETGDFTFILEQPLDHAIAGATGEDDTIELAFTILVEAPDGELFQGTITAVVEDDGPAATDNEAGTTDEEAALPQVLTGNLLNDDDGAGLDTFGGDGPAAAPISSVALGDQVATDTDDDGVITLEAADGSWTLEVFTRDGAGQSAGDYRFTLNGGFAHAPGAETASLAFVYTALDGDGDPSPAQLTVVIEDGVPQAMPDVALGVEEGAGAIAGRNLLDNDDAGPDNATVLSFTYTGAGGTPATSAAGSTVATALGGSLTVNPDGSWSYRPPAAITNPDDGEVTESFTYTIEDGDGDLSSAEQVILIADDDTPPQPAADGPGSDNDPGPVVEDAGVNGFVPAVLTGNVLVNDATTTDELATTPIANAVLVSDYAAGVDRTVTDSAIVFAAGDGVWRLTLDRASGDYRFELLAPYDHGGANDGANDAVQSIRYTVADEDGDRATALLSIQIRDDVPLARAGPALRLDEGDIANGVNLLANDDAGADGASVVSFTYAAPGGQTVTAAAGQTVMTALGGTLNVNSDGSWSYDAGGINLGSDDPARAIERFTYTVRDGDGDRSSAQQEVSVGNTIAPIGELVLNEIGLGLGSAPAVPGRVAAEGLDFVEILNAGDTTLVSEQLLSLTLELVGPDGNLTISLDGLSGSSASLQLAPGEFLVLYENGAYSIFTAAGERRAAGTFGDPGDWPFGEDTSEAIAVNLVQDGQSLDGFLANGADTGGLTGGEEIWEEVDLAAAGPMARALLQESEGQFSGLAGDQHRTLLSTIDPERAPDRPEGDDNRVFARVFTTASLAAALDSDLAADWTRSNVATDGRLNDAADPNPQDPAFDDFNPAQGDQNAADAGQNGEPGQGGAGPDVLLGSSDDDELLGEAHDDVLVGEAGDDRLHGGTGADFVLDTDGLDFMVGGSGNDILVANAEVLRFAGLEQSGGDVIVGDRLEEAQLPGFDISFVLDTSGSMAIVSHTISDVVVGAGLDGATNVDLSGTWPAGTVLRWPGSASQNGTVIEGEFEYTIQADDVGAFIGTFMALLVPADGSAPISVPFEGFRASDLDDLEIQLPGGAFAGGAEPGTFEIVVLNADTGQALGGSPAEVFGDTAPILTLKDAFSTVVESIAADGFAGVTQVQLVRFSNTAAEAGVFALDDPQEFEALLAAIANLQPGGATQFEAPLLLAADWLEERAASDPDHDRLLFFLSDGADNDGFDPDAGGAAGLSQRLTALEVDMRVIGLANTEGATNIDEAELDVVAGLSGQDGNQAVIVEPQQTEEVVAALTFEPGIVTAGLGEDVIFGGDQGPEETGDLIFADSVVLDFATIAERDVAGGLDEAGLRTAFEEDPAAFLRTFILGDEALLPLQGLAGRDDFIDGGAGADVILGQGGDDIIIGGSDDDTLWGGRGADRFVWRAGDEGTDTVADYDFDEGDALDLSQLLDGAFTDGQDVVADFVRIDAASGEVQVDTNGQGAFQETVATLETIEFLSQVRVVLDSAEQTIQPD